MKLKLLLFWEKFKRFFIVLPMCLTLVLFTFVSFSVSAAEYAPATFYYGYPGQYGSVVIETNNAGTVEFTGLYGQIVIDGSVTQEFNQDWFIVDCTFGDVNSTDPTDGLVKQSGTLQLNYHFYLRGDITGLGNLQMVGSDGMTIDGRGIWNGNYSYTTRKEYTLNNTRLHYFVTINIDFAKVSVGTIRNIRTEFYIPGLAGRINNVFSEVGYIILEGAEVPKYTPPSSPEFNAYKNNESALYSGTASSSQETSRLINSFPSLIGLVSTGVMAASHILDNIVGSNSLILTIVWISLSVGIFIFLINSGVNVIGRAVSNRSNNKNNSGKKGGKGS